MELQELQEQEKKQKLTNSEKQKLEKLQQRARFGRKLTDEEQEYLEELKTESIEDLTRQEKSDLNTLEALDKEEETSIRNSTKGRHLAGKAKYKHWCDSFNSTIRAAQSKQGLSSDWRESPFVRAMKMSVTDQWNDLYLAHAYPFLYARKLNYAFSNHGWECFLVLYGKLGLHLIVLMSLTLIIVGGYRALANCGSFAPSDSKLGIFAKQVR